MKPVTQRVKAIDAFERIISVANDGLGVTLMSVWGEKQRGSRVCSGREVDEATCVPEATRVLIIVLPLANHTSR